MKWFPFSIIFLLHLFCFGQEKLKIDKEYINFDDITRINDLFYFQRDTTLVSGRVIHYNKKNQGTKYIYVTNGKPHQLDWVYFKDAIEAPKKSALGNVLTGAAMLGGLAMAATGNDTNFVGIGSGFLDDYSDLGGQRGDDILNSYGNATKSKQTEYINESEDQQLEASKNSIQEITNGPYETYYNNGQLKTTGNYKNGERDGLWQNYYENGVLESQVTFTEGKMVGVLETYHLNGQLRGQVDYIDGKENGIMEIYYENGQLMMKGLFKEALQSGEWVYYDEQGEIIETENFKD